jgi:hypothetical protein
MTGLVMAGLIATLGLLVIPNRRRQAKHELREKVSALRERLGSSMRSAFEGEVQRSLERIGQHVEPYSRFVRAEQRHLDGARDTLGSVRRRLDAIRHRVLHELTTAASAPLGADR